eukprot:gnl/Chilomastix_cuspidata/1313.p2 GENE.gnl/Chilomastix_cuspidata/1313~~gnl/Chilomastix_cuspidata/1313.p2  ORF type:complete len:299 (+),score=148.19 gnl/Chilomastix_cuspidata/1313:150-1046(+)
MIEQIKSFKEVCEEYPTTEGLDLLALRQSLHADYLSSLAHICKDRTKGKAPSEKTIGKVSRERVTLERIADIEANLNNHITALLRTGAQQPAPETTARLDAEGAGEADDLLAGADAAEGARGAGEPLVTTEDMAPPQEQGGAADVRSARLRARRRRAQEAAARELMDEFGDVPEEAVALGAKLPISFQEGRRVEEDNFRRIAAVSRAEARHVKAAVARAGRARDLTDLRGMDDFLAAGPKSSRGREKIREMIGEEQALPAASAAPRDDDESIDSDLVGDLDDYAVVTQPPKRRRARRE